MKTQTECRIYVACLAAYNNGHLHGAWIDATQDNDEIWAEINAMLAASPIAGAEEWAIHDYDFVGLHLSENEDIERVHDLAVLIEKHGEAFAKFADNVGLEFASEEAFEEAFQGQWDSEIAFTENLIDDLDLLHDVPEILQRYFDTEAYSRDLFMSDYYSLESSESGIFVFCNI